MGKIITILQLNHIQKERNSGKKLIIVGGCFDILHAGHIEFLKKARELGDILIVLLESDEKIKTTKGSARPINSQHYRASILSKFAEYIVCLPSFTNNEDYELLVKKIQPDIIAITSGTHIFDWERKYVKNSKAEIIEVMSKKKNYSTSNFLENNL